jgi:hypothetical protein
MSTPAEYSLLITAVLGGVGSLLTAIVSAWISLRNSHKIDVLHQSTNSRMDELIAATRAEEQAKTQVVAADAKAEGAREGRAENKST